MKDKSKIILLYLNKARKIYRGISIEYLLSDKKSPFLIIDINVTGKFPLPIVSYPIFDSMLQMFLHEDLKYFGINYDNEIMLGDVTYNGKKLFINDIVLSKELKSGIDNIINRNKYHIDLDASPKIKLLKNVIDFVYYSDEAGIFFEFRILPKYLEINGMPVGEPEIYNFSDFSGYNTMTIVEPLSSYINHDFEFVTNPCSDEFWDLLESLGLYNDDELLVPISISVVSVCDGVGSIIVDSPDNYLGDHGHSIIKELINFMRLGDM